MYLLEQLRNMLSGDLRRTLEVAPSFVQASIKLLCQGGIWTTHRQSSDPEPHIDMTLIN